MRENTFINNVQKTPGNIEEKNSQFSKSDFLSLRKF